MSNAGICVAIVDPVAERQSVMTKALKRMSYRVDYELVCLKFIDGNAGAKIGKYASEIQVALISLDCSHGAQAGRTLYDSNPDCRILYYSDSEKALSPLLRSRPISFFRWREHCAGSCMECSGSACEPFLNELCAVFDELIQSKAIFRFENRKNLVLLDQKQILYFKSDLRYVEICLVKGENPRMITKLDAVEIQVSNLFIRVHKSYLVNTKHILSLDKKRHTLLLSSGEEIPISGAYYDETREKLLTV